MGETRHGLRALHPLGKLMFVVASIVVSACFDWRVALCGIIPLCLVLSAAQKVFVSYAKKLLMSVVLFVCFMIVFQLILHADAPDLLVAVGPVRITGTALWIGMQNTRVILTMISTILLFFEVTTLEELLIALRQLHMSHMLSYIILSSLQLILDMGKKSVVIMEAQQARGIETTGSITKRAKAFLPTLGPLVIASIADLQEKSFTLEVRGLTAQCAKTTLLHLVPTMLDWVIGVVCALAMVASVVWAFLG